ncbi:hypothetical protein [Rhodococcus sp. C3V]|uniref:hypothetical protein n=1 Tax=Rhodococcus sp. C3V TaxID=3034165 RepID=UPI0023E2B41C|nr:hypothetical protein [Rhodococcus sp. C3V]MDF3319717.1 hypothetical protein [Rhodococcus sp. C3V]
MTTAMTPTGVRVQRRSPTITAEAPRRWWRQVTIDLVLLIVIAGILGGVGSVVVGPLTGVVFALASAAAFRVVLQAINA